ncbi:acyl--CoA ligase [Mycobacterium sp. Y57]|uniref:class I adenylate-forming enzyme family protein n=1 Tax=Mycolicibacterium xanthum TaxID=2796469 RepID=UPI001C8520B1|nr:class I adenylate-forming enzyme family protein [Mycolicibacterium xanthum]MBX7430556.1 acyl--CoA ligase [Mycolicibacterium xanthum]
MTTEELTVAAVLQDRQSLGDKALLVCDGERLGYAEAFACSAAWARRLIDAGAGKGTHVGLLFPNGAQFVVVMLAVARIGAVLVPFSTFSTPPELRDQLVDADVEVLVSARGYRSHDYVSDLGQALGTSVAAPRRIFSPAAPVLRRIVFDDGAPPPDGDGDGRLSAWEDDVDGSDILAIIYTSGSTSAPKGVVHTHAGLLAHQLGLNEIRGLSADDRLFCNSPFFWIGGFAFGLLATLLAGATLICSNATDAAETLDLLEAEKPTLTNGFIAGIAHLTRHPSFGHRDLSSMRHGNLYPIMAPDARPADPELRHNMLGMTEAGSVLLISGDETDQPEARRGSYGRLAPGFQARVIDPDDGTDAGRSIGELLIRGPHVMQGYYGRSREECFDADGWFHTGDLVHRDADGFFYFVGRAGSMIKTAGANVSPAEVQKALTAALQSIDAGAAAHVVGLPDPDRGQIVGAVIATDAVPAPDPSALVTALRSTLSSYKIPRRFVTVRHAQVPVLSSGKVDFPALRKLFDG